MALHTAVISVTGKIKVYEKDFKIKEIRELVGNKKVIGGLSGGVDSSVMAVLIHKAIGKKLICVFVDNGLLRMDERKKIQNLFGLFVF